MRRRAVWRMVEWSVRRDEAMRVLVTETGLMGELWVNENDDCVWRREMERGCDGLWGMGEAAMCGSDDFTPSLPSSPSGVVDGDGSEVGWGVGWRVVVELVGRRWVVCWWDVEKRGWEWRRRRRRERAMAQKEDGSWREVLWRERAKEKKERTMERRIEKHMK